MTAQEVMPSVITVPLQLVTAKDLQIWLAALLQKSFVMNGCVGRKTAFWSSYNLPIAIGSIALLCFFVDWRPKETVDLELGGQRHAAGLSVSQDPKMIAGQSSLNR